MESNNDVKYQALARVVKQLLNLVIAMLLLILTMFGYLLYIQPQIIQKPSTVEVQALVSSPSTIPKTEINEDFWQAPDTSSIKDPAEKEMILYGKDLIANTSIYFGPKGKVKKNAINGMNCQNCHLDAGTRVFGNNYSAVFATYPKYRARSGTSEDLFKRVNDCFERSLNGEPLDQKFQRDESDYCLYKLAGKRCSKRRKIERIRFKRYAHHSIEQRILKKVNLPILKSV